MASLNWQSPSQKSSPSVTSSPASSLPHGLNPWFAVSVGLMGIIIGFSLGKWRIGDFPLLVGSPPSQIAQVPGVPSPTPPPPPPVISFENVPPVDQKKDHIRGNPNAEVAIVQYSDYECPFSKRVQETYKQIAESYGNKIAVIFRHFPLGFHQNAEPAAIAAECAAELGGNDAFWKFNDKVFAAQGEWAYETYAQDIGLDVVKFKDCIGNGKWKQFMQDQLSGGSKAGVSGTPSNFILNLKKKTVTEVGGAQPFESFKSAIDAALQG